MICCQLAQHKQLQHGRLAPHHRASHAMRLACQSAPICTPKQGQLGMRWHASYKPCRPQAALLAACSHHASKRKRRSGRTASGTVCSDRSRHTDRGTSDPIEVRECAAEALQPARHESRDLSHAVQRDTCTAQPTEGIHP